MLLLNQWVEAGYPGAMAPSAGAQPWCLGPAGLIPARLWALDRVLEADESPEEGGCPLLWGFPLFPLTGCSPAPGWR